MSDEQQHRIEAALEVLGDELLDRAPGLPSDRPAGRRRAQKSGRGPMRPQGSQAIRQSGWQWPRPRRTMTPIPMNEPVTSLPQAALLAIMLARRYRPGQHHHHNGFLQHVFATSPWLGAMMAALIVVGLVLALIKKAGRVLEGTPWYVRLALLVTGFGIFRLLSRKKRATPNGIWRPPDGWEPAPPRDRAV